SIGGAGKSPITTRLAARLLESGRNPAILTRGYRRKSHEDAIVPRGGKAPIESTGDEAQIFICRGIAHVGIGADRFSIGRRMERELAPDIFLLDDGFQHRRLHRDHDIVLIDALDPFAGGVFPLGRLREPPESLARADTIIVTRVESGQDISGIEKWIARYNAAAPVFHSRVVPLGWVDAETGAAEELPPGRIAAFCGLGSPRAFWRTLDEMGVHCVQRRAFPDHHRYRREDLKNLAASADVLVTTEKDMMNLWKGTLQIIAPRKLFWLKIEIEIEREDELLRRIS
ncbi:MAG: tetraacyldisaccharide 4'-kinase, partial [Bryobacteraceae bacterium]